MLSRLLLALTTRRPHGWELAETGLDRLAADLAREGWSVRFAGPAWDAIWTREWQAPVGRRILVLPDPGNLRPGPWAQGSAPCWQHLVHHRLRLRAEALA